MMIDYTFDLVVPHITSELNGFPYVFELEAYHELVRYVLDHISLVDLQKLSILDRKVIDYVKIIIADPDEGDVKFEKSLLCGSYIEAVEVRRGNNGGWYVPIKHVINKPEPSLSMHNACLRIEIKIENEPSV